MKHRNAANSASPSTFDTTGIEGLLDVVLGCTLIFMLMTALVSVDRGQPREVSLPPIELTKTANCAPGTSQSRRINISVRMVNDKPRIWLEERKISPDQLERELRTTGLTGVGHVALRRDQRVPCAVEDQIILACKRAGIERVALVVQESQN